MTEAPRPDDEVAALRAAVERLTARLDRIEAQGAPSTPTATVQARVADAWDALRGRPQTGDALAGKPRSGLLWTAVTVCAVLLALILAIELAEEVFDGLWHLGRWHD